MLKRLMTTTVAGGLVLSGAALADGHAGNPYAEYEGTTLVLEQPASSPIGSGDDIEVTIETFPDGTPLVSFYDFQRETPNPEPHSTLDPRP